MLQKIQQGRALLMGFAILWVISFHYQFLDCTPIGAFTQKGFLGVDIFIALSAFGLCFSLSKESNYIKFLKKRVLRIVPTWWLIITVMLLLAVVQGKDNYPHTVFQYICYYSGLGWWFCYDQPYGIYYYEWYIPTILAFYIITPFLYKQSNRTLILTLTLSSIGCFLLSYFEISERLQFSYLRIPTLIYGVLLYRMYMAEKQGKMIKSTKQYLYTSSVIGFFAFLMNTVNLIELPLGVLIYSFMLSLPLFFYLIVQISKLGLTRILSFVGGITLELYLLHIYNIPLAAVARFISNREVAICVTVILLIPIAYLLQKAITHVMGYTKPKQS